MIATVAVLAAGALLAALAGCAAQAPNTVNIQYLEFTPSTLTVPVGTTVVWTNNDQTAHQSGR